MNMPRIIVIATLLLTAISRSPALEPETIGLAGATMGTTYAVKVYDPPQFEQDLRLQVDALLRRVNDQMSTYIDTSEISRFNDSRSTDWFDVSPETAMVVAKALEVSEKTDGAFDVTVAPLVNAWSFGPEPKTNDIPDAAKIEALRKSVGYKHLSARADPPAIRKEIPELMVDLSAIAKGHGVDRVIELLTALGAENAFVEIGGEVRVSGNKSGQWWKVGIESPETANTRLLAAHSLGTGSDDNAIATSGSYRNFFEVDGVRYSHTIDPRTGWPVKHQLQSVSVIAPTCMDADAWATALNVLGDQAGLEMARREGLDVLLVSDQDGSATAVGNGALARYASGADAAGADAAGAGAAGAGGGNAAERPAARVNPPLAIAAVTFVAFAVLLFAMSVGVMFGRRSISGSCGGIAGTRNEDGTVACGLCSNPSEACKELRNRMKSGQSA